MDNAPPRGLRAWLTHAFAIEAYNESSLTEGERALLSGFAASIHARGLSTPAIWWLQTNRHMNWVWSQVLVFTEPLYDMSENFLKPFLRAVGLYVPSSEMPVLISAFEKRFSIEYFTRQLEARQAGEIVDAPEASAESAGPPPITPV